MQAGAKVEKMELPDLLHGVGAMYHLATAEMLSGSNSFKRALKELGSSQVIALHDAGRIFDMILRPHTWPLDALPHCLVHCS